MPKEGQSDTKVEMKQKKRRKRAERKGEKGGIEAKAHTELLCLRLGCAQQSPAWQIEGGTTRGDASQKQLRRPGAGGVDHRIRS